MKKYIDYRLTVSVEISKGCDLFGEKLDYDKSMHNLLGRVLLLQTDTKKVKLNFLFIR
jgi:hypothetical protein